MTQSILTNQFYCDAQLVSLGNMTEPIMSCIPIMSCLPHWLFRKSNSLIFEECGPSDFFCPFVVIAMCASSLSLKDLRFSNLCWYYLNWLTAMWKDAYFLPNSVILFVWTKAIFPILRMSLNHSRYARLWLWLFYCEVPFQGLSNKWFSGRWALRWGTVKLCGWESATLVPGHASPRMLP